MSQRRLKLVIAGGGTGGHVQPALATLAALRRNVPVDARWIGSVHGVERTVAERQAIPFHAIQTGKLRRYASWETPVDALRIPVGILQATMLLRRQRPDVVFSTGGFVSVPTVMAARALGIPSLSHEQTATIGLATRINARFCDVIALSHESTVCQLKSFGGRVAVTGNPVRRELLDGDREAGFRAFGLDPKRPLIYVTGGTLGAQILNRTVEDALPELLPLCQVVHQCGDPKLNGDEPRLLNTRETLTEELRRGYVVRSFIGAELADLYAAADLVVGRAGAGTVAELAALGKPSLLIPLPGTSSDEQTVNAMVLADAGASKMLSQSELTPERLVEEIRRLLNSDRRERMAEKAKRLGRRDADSCLASEILRLAGYPSDRS